VFDAAMMQQISRDITIYCSEERKRIGQIYLALAAPACSIGRRAAAFSFLAFSVLVFFKYRM
jgi:hypothetical protein